MHRKIIQLAMLLAAGLPALPAQQPPPNRPPTVHGIPIPSVAGLPFSATVVLESERPLPDGSSLVRRTINVIARDAKGRTRNEVRRLMPESFHGSPELLSVRLFDPGSRIRTTCNLEGLTGKRQFVPNAQTKPSVPNPSVRLDDLGTSTMNGLQVKGTRRTTQVEDAYGEPVDVEDETWYSPELHLTLLARHSDPRIGVQSIGISTLKREEPPASLFDVPPGCSIQDVPLVGAPAQPTAPAPAEAEPTAEPPS